MSIVKSTPTMVECRGDSWDWVLGGFREIAMCGMELHTLQVAMCGVEFSEPGLQTYNSWRSSAITFFLRISCKSPSVATLAPGLLEIRKSPNHRPVVGGFHIVAVCS